MRSIASTPERIRAGNRAPNERDRTHLGPRGATSCPHLFIWTRIVGLCSRARRQPLAPQVGAVGFSPAEFVPMKRLIVGALVVVFAGCGSGGDDASSSEGTQRPAGQQSSTGPSGTTVPEGPLGPIGHTGGTEPEGGPTLPGPQEAAGARGAVTAVGLAGPVRKTGQSGLISSSGASADRVGATNSRDRSPP